MASRPKRGFWRTCRVYFRRFRIAAWLVVLLLVGILAYLNQVGLPDLLKRPLLDKLHARGLDLQFSRLRLRWDEGIVAENVHFGRAGEPLTPHLAIAEVRLQISLRALCHGRLQVDAVRLRQGRLVWPVAEPEGPPRQLALERIQATLRFLPNDQWALDHFAATFAGAKIQLSGTVTNATAVREWPFLRARPAVAVGEWQTRLRWLADAVERVQFPAPPELSLDVNGDARDLRTFTLRLTLSAPGALTPWGAFEQGCFTASLFLDTNQVSQAQLRLEAALAQTPWGAFAQGRLEASLAPAHTNVSRADLHVVAAEAQTRWAAITNFQFHLLLAAPGASNGVSGELELAATRIHTEWGEASNALFTAHWLQAVTNPAAPLFALCTFPWDCALTNPPLLSAEVRLDCDKPQTQWGSARQLHLAGHLDTTPSALAPGLPPPPSPIPAPDPSWTWWTNLQPWRLRWQCQLTGLQSPKLEAETVTFAGRWRAPELTITNLGARLYGGRLAAHAALDVATRALSAGLASSVDPHQLYPLLPEAAQRWLAAFAWNQPPQVTGQASLVLPAWTNRHPNWRAEVQPTLRLQGEFNLDHGGAYRRIPVSTARSHFSYSNMVWRLPDLAVTRPEGRLEATHQADDRTRDFYWRLDGILDPQALRPLLTTNEQRVLDDITFTQPPLLDAEVWGRYHEPERTGFRGRVALTNFTFRNQSASDLQTAFAYTNRLLQFFNPRIRRGTQDIRADGLAADFNAQLVFLTNGFSTAEPMVIARAIGPQVARAIERYQFMQPPRAQVHGVIPMHGEEGADLHFDLDGGPFLWWKFEVPHIKGHVHWLGEQLTLTNVNVEFYDGQAVGAAAFDFLPRKGTDFRFEVAITNCNLQRLVADLFSRTNRLEGQLSGTLSVTKANTDTWRSVGGYGNLALRDGLIWDIPIFGVFSGVLNNIAPGLGNSRISAATCGFVITNGVIRSDKLEMRSPALRLQYRGTVDLEGRANARVEAELLRDVWLVGPMVSTVFWPVTKLFEYKVTGSINDPKTEPLYFIPKVVLLPFQMPFHPFRSLKGLLPGDWTSPATNTPPASTPNHN